MASIALHRLVCRYGSVEAVRGVDLEIPDGEVTVLVGPSGCGKTTILRTIAGLERAAEGRVDVGGRDVTTLEPKDRDVAMVFQNYALYPNMSVADNIAFGLRARKVERAEIERRVAQAAAMLEIDALLGRRPKALSGGQQQRVAIGRAIVREPAAFLFDEPLSNLDAKLRVGMRTEILKIQRELGATLLHVTHDQEEAMTLADHVVVMERGEIVQRGAPVDVYRRPATEFVARFVGSPEINLLDAGRAAALTGGRSIGARAGIRPEDIRLDDGGAGTATVTVVELLGAHAIVVVREDDGLELRALVDARTLDAIHEGKRVTPTVDPGAVHHFDAHGCATSA